MLDKKIRVSQFSHDHNIFMSFEVKSIKSFKC